MVRLKAGSKGMGKSDEPVKSMKMEQPLEDRIDDGKMKRYKEMLLSGDVFGAANSIERSPEDSKFVGKLLGHAKAPMRLKAAKALASAANRADISTALPALINALSEKDKDTRERVVITLGYALVFERSRGNTLEALIQGLSNPVEVIRSGSAIVLRTATYAGIDITAALPALANKLTDSDETVRTESVSALKYAAKTGKHCVRKKITALLLEFTQSGWLMNEASANSVAFASVVTKVAELTKSIDKAEKGGH